MMAHEFQLLRRILKERSGIELGEDKVDLVEAKLRPLLKEFEFPSFARLALALMKPDADDLRSRVAQAVAVQESHFFRDKTPFQYFADTMLPQLMERRGASRRIRIWCAGAASGQEPYSLAMLLAEDAQKLGGWTVDIVATDFVEDSLIRARKGIYSQFEVQRGLPVSKLVKYFRKVGNGWEIKPEISSKVAFCKYNLLDDCQRLGTFDIIFCRNVLIYFDEPLRRAVLGRLAGQLASDGYLVLGAAETATRFSSDFMPVPEGCHGIYCLTPAAIAARTPRLVKARRVPETDDRPPSSGGGHVASADEASQAERAPAADAQSAAIKLDKKTAELLEARAKACGLSVAELLAAFVAAEDHTPAGWQALRLKAVG